MQFYVDLEDCFLVTEDMPTGALENIAAFKNERTAIEFARPFGYKVWRITDAIPLWIDAERIVNKPA